MEEEQERQKEREGATGIYMYQQSLLLCNIRRAYSRLLFLLLTASPKLTMSTLTFSFFNLLASFMSYQTEGGGREVEKRKKGERRGKRRERKKRERKKKERKKRERKKRERKKSEGKEEDSAEGVHVSPSKATAVLRSPPCRQHPEGCRRTQQSSSSDSCSVGA